MLARLVQTWFAINVANKSKRSCVTGFPLASVYCKHAGNVIIGRSNVCTSELLFEHIWSTKACKTGTNSVGVIPGIFKQVKSNPARLGLETTPSVIILHTSVANLNTTSVTVSPEHRFIHAMSGPCHTTQFDDILSHPFVEMLELVGIINIFFTIM